MDLGIAAGTKYAEDALTVQPVLLGEGATAAPGDAYHPLGIIGRPVDSDTDKQSGDVTNGARVLFWYQGSTLHTVILDDPRATQKLKALAPGEAMFYSPGKPDTAYAHYAADGALEVRASTGTTVTVQVGGGPAIVTDGVTVKCGGDQMLILSTPLLAFLAALGVWFPLAEAAIEAIPAPLSPTQLSAIQAAAQAVNTLFGTAPTLMPTKITLGV